MRAKTNLSRYQCRPVSHSQLYDSQSSHPGSRVMKIFVYIRAHSRGVATVRQTAMVATKRSVCEYGSTRLGVTPGGGGKAPTLVGSTIAPLLSMATERYSRDGQSPSCNERSYPVVCFSRPATVRAQSVPQDYDMHEQRRDMDGWRSKEGRMDWASTPPPLRQNEKQQPLVKRGRRSTRSVEGDKSCQS